MLGFSPHLDLADSQVDHRFAAFYSGAGMRCIPAYGQPPDTMPFLDIGATFGHYSLLMAPSDDR
jgi:hypothetical protein